MRDRCGGERYNRGEWGEIERGRGGREREVEGGDRERGGERFNRQG